MAAGRPRTVLALIERRVVEKATVVIDGDGAVLDLVEVHDEVEWLSAEVRVVLDDVMH